MAIKYVIRKAAFHYSDDCAYFHTMGAIIGDVYNDSQEAHDNLMILEREAYLSTDLGDIEPFSGCSSDVPVDMMVNLQNYFEKELGLDILKVQHRKIYADRDSFLPESITNEQIKQIRNLSGLKFYDLVEFTDEPQFYGIWEKTPFYNEEGFKDTSEASETPDSVYFYNSYMEAYEKGIYYCYSDFNGTEIEGKLEEISDTPIILQTFIESSSNISYDESRESLTIKSMWIKEWASLYTLLKNKPFEIRVLNFEDVKNCEQYAYECM